MVSRTLGAVGEARCRALEMLGALEARVGRAAPRGFVSCLSGAGPQTTAEHASRSALGALDLLSRLERTRHESRGRHRGAFCPACPERAAADRDLLRPRSATRGRSRRRRGGAGARETQPEVLVFRNCSFYFDDVRMYCSKECVVKPILFKVTERPRLANTWKCRGYFNTKFNNFIIKLVLKYPLHFHVLFILLHLM